MTPAAVLPDNAASGCPLTSAIFKPITSGTCCTQSQTMVFWLLALLLVSAFSQSGAAECLDDWTVFQGSCYVFIDDLVGWTDAWTVCKTMDAKIVTIETPDENDFVSAQLRMRGGDRGAWIGFQDFVKEGRWVLADTQEPSEYTHWAPGEPNNDRDQDCGVIRANGQWDDDLCDATHQVVCEKT